MSEPARDQQLEAILHSYLQASDAGKNPDREELLRRHPEFADELREFFSDQAKLDRMAHALKQAHAGDITIGAEETVNAPKEARRVRYVGDYELQEEIARGGMGIVYRARQVSLNRVVALKMILAGQFATDADVQRFHAEAEAAANLDHPNIVQIYEVGEHEGQHYFSMKLIEGSSLAKEIPRLVAEPKQAVRLLATVARAVHHAHQHGILHRDLKPSNILLGGQGQPHVTDFGLAKRVDRDSGLSRTGSIMGTPSYMAPEQAAARKDLSTAVDVYSLGAILFELLTGRPPFRAETPLNTLLLLMEAEPTRPSVLNARVDKDVETICLKCLEKNPQARYGSAEALAEDLERWLSGEPILARPSTPWERTVKWARRKPALAALVAVTFVATMVTFVGGLVFNAFLQVALRDVANRQIDLDKANAGIKGEQEAARKANDAAGLANRLADERAARARGILLSGNSAAVRPANPGLALLLAVEGAELCPGLFANNTLFAALGACREQRTLLGHRDGVLFATFSPDGGRVLTGSADKTARIWNALTGALLATLKSHEDQVLLGSFSPDGSRVVTLATDGTARTWDATSGRLLATMRSRGKYNSGTGHCSARFSPDGRSVVTAFGAHPDFTAGLWETDTGKAVALFKGHKGPVTSAAFSTNGKRIVTASDDRTARIWEASSGKELFLLKGHKCSILHALFSPDDQRVLTTGAGYDRVVQVSATGEVLGISSQSNSETVEGMAGRIWDAASGKELGALWFPGGNQAMVRTATFSQDGSKILIAAVAHLGSPVAGIWDAKTGKWLLALKDEGFFATEAAAAFSPDGLRVATVWDKTPRLWDVTTGQREAILKGHEGQAVSVAFSPDSQRLVTAGNDQTARIWDASFGPEADNRKGIWSGFNSALFSPDGRQLIATYNLYDEEKTYSVLWDTQTGREHVRLPHAKNYYDLGCFSFDGKKVITASTDKLIHVWDTATGKELAVLGPEARTRMSAFSEDGRFVATTDETDDGNGYVFNAATGKKLAEFQSDDAHGIRTALFSPNGKLVVTIGGGREPFYGGRGPARPEWDGETVIACVWDAATGTKLIWLKDVSSKDSAPAHCAVFRFDSKWLLTASGNSANLWDLSTANSKISSPPKGAPFKKPSQPIVMPRSEITSPQLTLKGHENTVNHASFSPDGSRVVTASEDRTARIWDGRTGEVLAVLKGHQGALRFACFSPDGKLVLTHADDNTVRLWNALTGKETATFSAGNDRSALFARFSTDGQRLLVAWFGEARVWPVDLLAAARQRRPRDLTQTEREQFELEAPARP